MTVYEQDDQIVRVVFGHPDKEDTGSSVLLEEARDQLSAYLDGRIRRFSLPLAPQGTPFQLACWEALCHIPYGETRTYAQQAAAIGRPKACRAVGMANHCNPLPILIPCHRVIGADGKLTGYGGGLLIKKELLALEGIRLEDSADQRVPDGDSMPL